VTKKLGSKHSDIQAVIRAGKKGAKHRTAKRNRRLSKLEARADQRLREETLHLTDSWVD
jgi:hypothetical protein